MSIIAKGDLKLTTATYHFKMLLLGDAAVGKTTLVTRFVKGKFRSDYKMTIGVDILSKDVEVNNEKAVLSIWDIAGQERFKSFRNVFYRGASAAFIVFDLTRAQTFQNLGNWVDELKRFVESPVSTVIVGNKVDLEDLRDVRKEDAEGMAKSIGSLYLETSAKTGQKVDEAFTTLTKGTIARIHSRKK
ncbi:MAG: Rab family GTPase [Promethearchaeota archaeon]